ncbi:MAG TPA: ABC transporter permease [Streptosporangiaceae bacterium]|nr:ABC transporter permease [Streptosporangiaceae bacterium]
MRSRLSRVFLLPGAVWLLILFVVPFGIVIAVSLGTTNVVGFPVYGWHPGNYAMVFQPLFLPVLLRSVLFAVVTTALCLLIGYPVAYTVARFGGRYKNALIALLLLPWFVDYLVRIYAWVVILGNEGLLNGLLAKLGMHGNPPVRFIDTPYAVIGGLVYDYLPFMIFPIYAALEQMNPAVIEAGKDLYGTPGRTFWHVTWPSSLQGVLAGCVLVSLPAVGDFATAQLLGGPNTYMIGNLISDQMVEVTGAWPFGAALTVVLMALLSFAVIAYVRSAARATAEAIW